MRLKDKVAIITGSTSGIGRATAVLFAREGAKVVVTGKDEEKAAKAVVDEIKANGGQAIYMIGDASNLDFAEALVNKTIETYGPVDILVNNAGVMSTVPLEEITMEEFHKVYRVNVDFALRLTQLVVPGMKKKGKGVIVNTASAASYTAHVGDAAGHVAYISSKHAMAGLTKSMAWELGPEIRANAIAPGLIHTAMVDSVGGPSACQPMIDGCPLKRIGTSEETAEIILFLATDDSAFINGQIIKVDGGFEV